MQVRAFLEQEERRPPRVCHPDRRISDVLRQMDLEGFDVIPIVENGKLLAVVTRDELQAAISGQAPSADKPLTAPNAHLAHPDQPGPYEQDPGSGD